MTNDPACGNGFAMPGKNQPDAVALHYRDWLQACQDWERLADVPGNGNWDNPASDRARERMSSAEEAMLAQLPSTPDGIAALIAVAWNYLGPTSSDPAEFTDEAMCPERRALLAIWRACAGREGYPGI